MSIRKPRFKERKLKKRLPATVYFWWSDAGQRRIGFFYPSKQEAMRWVKQRWWRYVEYPVLEHFLETVPVDKRCREEMLWRAAKDNYFDLSLEKGFVYYQGDKFKYEEQDDE